jgi:hypothetical protein
MSGREPENVRHWIGRQARSDNLQRSLSRPCAQGKPVCFRHLLGPYGSITRPADAQDCASEDAGDARAPAIAAAIR